MTEPTLERLSAALAGRYVIERELGRGARATVFRARDLRRAHPPRSMARPGGGPLAAGGR